MLKRRRNGLCGGRERLVSGTTGVGGPIHRRRSLFAQRPYILWRLPPSAFVHIVLDSQLEVKKVLQCLLLNAGYACDVALCPNVVSALLWNSEKSVSASISDIIHLIQYYCHTSSYDNAVADVEAFRLEPLRGMHSSWPRFYARADRRAMFRYRKE